MSDKLNQAIEQEELRRVLSQHAYAYFKDGENVASIIEKLTTLNNNADFPLNKEEIEEIVKEKSKKSTVKSKDDNIKQVSYIYNDNYILEQCFIPSFATHATHATHAENMVFLKYDINTGTTEFVNEFLVSDCIYRPIVDDLTATKSVKLPTGIEEYGTTKELVEDIKKFLYSYFEVPGFFEEFIPYLILFYWVFEKFPFIPYIHFVGLTGTGKTTAQEVMGSICYKPIDASGSLTLSPIFRTASKWGGTMLLDEFEPDGDSFKEMLLFLKGTVGDKVILKTEGDSKREVKAYLAKCPKIFTSENPINNAGLQSRTIVIKMEKNKRRIPLYRLGKFEVEAQHLRNKLLLWRFHHLPKINLDDIEYGFSELEMFDRRVQQVITPIYYFSDEETKKSITQFAQIQEEETHRERRDSLEGQIFNVIISQYPNETTLTAIAKVINEDRPMGKPMSEKRLGNIIRKVLQFPIERKGHDNASTISIGTKQDKIEELCKYFGISLESVASVASVANGTLELTDNP